MNDGVVSFRGAEIRTTSAARATRALIPTLMWRRGCRVARHGQKKKRGKLSPHLTRAVPPTDTTQNMSLTCPTQLCPTFVLVHVANVPASSVTASCRLICTSRVSKQLSAKMADRGFRQGLIAYVVKIIAGGYFSMLVKKQYKHGPREGWCDERCCCGEPEYPLLHLGTHRRCARPG